MKVRAALVVVGVITSIACAAMEPPRDTESESLALARKACRAFDDAILVGGQVQAPTTAERAEAGRHIADAAAFAKSAAEVSDRWAELDLAMLTFEKAWKSGNAGVLGSQARIIIDICE